MIGHTAAGAANEGQISRRHFMRKGGALLGLSLLGGFFGRSLFAVAPNFYDKAWARRDFEAGPITVFKMVPLPGRKYANADRGHLANKIFPSIEAARSRRPHAAFFYGLKPVELPRSVVKGINASSLFNGRKDLDVRVATDRRHCQRLGIDVDNIFELIRKV